MADSMWAGDWRGRLQKKLFAIGIASVTDFCKKHPGLSYLELADRLGPNVAADQLTLLLKSEAPDVSWHMRDSLVRELNHFMPNGWEPDESSAFTRIHASSSWLSEFEEPQKTIAKRAWQRLKAMPPPSGWKPEGPDDRLILKAFEERELP